MLVRNPRHFEVTELGRELFQRGLKIRDETHSALAMVQDGRDEPGGAPDEHFDLIIQPARRALADSSMVAQRLMVSPYVLVAAPELISTTGFSVDPRHAIEWPAIGWSFAEQVSKWTLWNSDGDTAVVPVKVRHHSDSLLVIRKAALAGLGVAQLPLVLCEQDITDGALAIVAPGWVPVPIDACRSIVPGRTGTGVVGARRELTTQVEPAIGILSSEIATTIPLHPALRSVQQSVHSG